MRKNQLIIGIIEKEALTRWAQFFNPYFLEFRFALILGYTKYEVSINCNILFAFTRISNSGTYLSSDVSKKWYQSNVLNSDRKVFRVNNPDILFCLL